MDAFEQSGKNFGNLLIGASVRRYLTNSQLIERHQIGSPAEADERCDHVVIPAANFLWKDFDFGYMVDFLEKTNLPITIIGVGAQTNDRSRSSPIHANTLRLMQLISARSATIGVRGYYTAEVLAAHGIHNIEVIGCPSLFWSRRPVTKVDVTRLRDMQDVSVNFSRRVNRHSFDRERMRGIENVVLEFALQRSSTFVAQDEIEELALSAGDAVNTESLTSYFDNIDSATVLNFFKSKTRYFRDVEEWGSWIRTKSFSIGSRFHGNLIALVHGVPALTVIHDSRTMELCTLMGFPSVHVGDESNALTDVATLMERIQALSFERFESGYSVLFRRFVGFLNRNGLSHNLPSPL